MRDILQQIYWSNTLEAYLIAIGGVIAAWLVLKGIQQIVIHGLKKKVHRTDNIFDDLLIEGIDRFLIPCIYLVVNYLIITRLTLHEKLAGLLNAAILAIIIYFVVRLINFMIHGAILVRMTVKHEAPGRIKQLSGVLLVVKIIVWSLGLITFIDNLGYDITTIIAGLGIGGIAIALAAQNILGDLFSYFVIFFDKPFEIGDFIVAEDYSGIVEKIGIKTTQVRSLDGQQLIMPNSNLVKTVIHNYKRLEKRRVVFGLRLMYSTPSEKIRQVPAIMKEIIGKKKDAAFDRAHLKTFGEFSIEYEVVYYIRSPDYLVYMNIHQEICFAIFDRFEKEGIRFALPTQIVHTKKMESSVFV